MNGHSKINGNGIIEESLTTDNELTATEAVFKLKANRYAENEERSTGL